MREKFLLDVVVLRTVGAQPVLNGVHHFNVQLLQLQHVQKCTISVIILLAKKH
jgi:hypothetical protein